MQTLNIGIYLFDDVEVLDFAGPFEVFSVASRVYKRHNPSQPKPFEVFTLAQYAEEVLARGSLRVRPHHTFESVPPLDLLIVPGGVVDEELEKPEVLDFIAEQSESAQIIASVCTGAFLLAKAGLLEGKTAATHWEDADDLERMFPGLKVERGVLWVDHGQVVTSGGISAGIEMSLHLLERLLGTEVALATARQMEYPWRRRIEA
ncbi:MAG TPA: DJ-1/PfpI family protein [Meiothermus sp.]|nr:DJ-1/PfpI family protein [Meiothermus sp.]